MLDHDDAAVRRHVSVFPVAADVRPYRTHHAAVTDDDDLVVGMFLRDAVEDRGDALEHVLMPLAVGRTPHPGTLRIESRIVGDGVVRLSSEVAQTHFAELRLV